CYYSIIDTESKKIIFAKAGHHHPFFWNSATDSFNNITSLGPGLGIIDDPLYSAVEMEYNAGDKLLFFTDGIIEQRNDDNKMYTTGRLSTSFKNAITDNESNILDRLFEDLHAFSGDMEYEDDITMLLYEF
ncbi:MAG: serine/threonine-protein phosphatase, partial [Clostridia bacterium]|nr:serine/threonine-protein phosphatase [Clostridia bacterium]